MSGNEAWNRNVFLNADGRLTDGADITVRQAVPDGGSGDREGPAAHGRQFHFTSLFINFFNCRWYVV